MKYFFQLLSVFAFLFSSTVSFADSNALPEFKQKNLYFISPHPDDIPLTFGGLIQKENGFKDHINHYIVFFNISNWTANYINLQTNQRVNAVTLQRIQEDVSALTQLFGSWKNIQPTFYGLLDATLRNYQGPKTAGGGPGGNFSTFRNSEKKEFNNVYQAVKPILAKQDCAAFVLMANGYHIDHFIVREAVIKAAHDLGDQAKCQIYFGEDQPYTGANPNIATDQINQFIKRLGLVSITYPIDINKKIAVFENNYISQYDPTYIPGLKARASILNNGERIYLWPMKNYKMAPTDNTCKQPFCQL